MKMVILLLSILIVCTSLPYADSIKNSPFVPALYVFGDSTVDGGNNKAFLVPPYGVDLNGPIEPRFTNGETFADYLATFLGLPLVPASNNMAKSEYSTAGVNYGYGGSGILPQTRPSDTWTFDTQISRFNSTIINSLRRAFPHPVQLSNHLRDSLFLVSFGINDFDVNYLRPDGVFAGLKPDLFATLLARALSERLKTLYAMGARNFVVNNIWPMGCMPYRRDGSGNCKNSTNDSLLPYSKALPVMLKELATDLLGFNYTCFDDFKFVDDLELHANQTGISNTRDACWALNQQSLCPNRDAYLYFDGVHTTQATNKLFAESCFNGTVCSPYSIQVLVGA